jgi:histidine ammonia-lyase
MNLAQAEITQVLVTGDDMTMDALLAVACRGVRVVLTDMARERIRAARAVVDRVQQTGEIVYGLNTDVGPLLKKLVPDHELEQFQVRTLVGHTVAWGTELDTTTVRAMMLARINGIAKGGAGVRLEVAEKLVELLNKRVHPVVVSGSSVGQSDLSEMAQIAQVLVGLGHAEYGGQRLRGATALAEAGVMPLTLAAKEALALMSANGVTLGRGTMVLNRAINAARAFDVSAALALEAFGGNLSIINPAATRLKPHPGPTRVAARLRQLLKDSYLWQPGAARNLQDPLSFRCVPQVHGALDEALERLQTSMEIELNSAADNPLVNVENEEVVSVGNFDVTNLSVGFDTLRIALVHVINLANERIQKQMWSYFSGLPTGLEHPDDPLSRMIPLARTTAILAGEAQVLSVPASVSCRVQIGEGIEDHASAAPLAILQTERLLHIVQRIIALELLISAAAVKLRNQPNLGRGTRQVVDYIQSGPWTRATDWPAAIDRLLDGIKEGRLDRMDQTQAELIGHLREVVARSGIDLHNDLDV